MTAEDTKEYWKQQAEQYKRNYEASHEELIEFQEQSRELEKELETQLEQGEKKINDLAILNERLTGERDSFRDRMETSSEESRKQISRLEEELRRVTEQRDQLQSYIRGLEQTNDDLERAQRNVTALLEDLEKRLETTLERNALLESEVDEKDSLQSTVRHLKEETQELKQELAVREKLEKERPTSAMMQNSFPAHQQHEGTPQSDSSTQMTPMTERLPALAEQSAMDVDESNVMNTPAQHSRENIEADQDATGIPRSMTVDGGTPINRKTTTGQSTPAAYKNSPYTPAARISALNIVGDLLRKVGGKQRSMSGPSERRMSTGSLCHRSHSFHDQSVISQPIIDPLSPMPPISHQPLYATLGRQTTKGIHSCTPDSMTDPIMFSTPPQPVETSTPLDVHVVQQQHKQQQQKQQQQQQHSIITTAIDENHACDIENVPPDPMPDFVKLKLTKEKRSKGRRSSLGSPMMSRLMGAASRVNDMLRNVGRLPEAGIKKSLANDTKKQSFEEVQEARLSLRRKTGSKSRSRQQATLNSGQPALETKLASCRKYTHDERNGGGGPDVRRPSALVAPNSRRRPVRPVSVHVVQPAAPPTSPLRALFAPCTLLSSSCTSKPSSSNREHSNANEAKQPHLSTDDDPTTLTSLSLDSTTTTTPNHNNNSNVTARPTSIQTPKNRFGGPMHKK